MKEFNSIDEILDFAINGEQEAVEFYTRLADQAISEDMKNVFHDFAREEMGHKAKLLNIKETGIVDLPSEKITDLKLAEYTVDIKPTPNITYQDALILAMKKEKAAFKLYSALAQRTSGEFKNLFLGLALEESKHKLRFEIEYDEFVLKEN